VETAVVLGAGGAFGWVFHAGVMRALAAEAGIDGTTAGLLVGTSAGAAVAGALRAGATTAEIVAAATSGPDPDQQAEMLSQVRSVRKTLRPHAAHLVRPALRAGRPVLAAGSLLPPGWFPTSFLRRFPGLDAAMWPDGLWIPAVRADDGARVVFGRDRTDVTLHEAVEASSAVPGMFRPKLIDGVTYLDGGLASPTNADLVAALLPDLVVISSPMSRRSGRFLGPHARRRLDEEVAVLERSGTRVVVVEPPADLVAASRGFPRRNPDRAPRIEAAAAAVTRAALSAPGARIA
jgi:NTE family protein